MQNALFHNAMKHNVRNKYHYTRQTKLYDRKVKHGRNMNLHRNYAYMHNLRKTASNSSSFVFIQGREKIYTKTLQVHVYVATV